MAANISPEEIGSIVTSVIQLAISLINQAFQWKGADDAKKAQLRADSDAAYQRAHDSIHSLDTERAAINSEIDAEADRELGPKGGE